MIPIQNVYYMLSYAFQVLNEQGYKDFATEQFNNVAELCAAILTKGFSIQLKRGLNREYIEQSDALSAIRGRIEITESLKTRSTLKKQLICAYDEFSVNSYMNRIIKTTMELLLRSDISKARKNCVRFWFFSAKWNRLTSIASIGVLSTTEITNLIVCLSLFAIWLSRAFYKPKPMDLRGLWTSWMNKGCIGCMRNSFWSITEKNIRRFPQTHHRFPGSWTMI